MANVPELQSTNVSPSKAHVVVTGAPAVVKVYAGSGLRFVAPVGPPVRTTVGAVVSVTQVADRDARLPAASVASIRIVCACSASAEVTNGAAHGTGAALSSLHVTCVAPPVTVNAIDSGETLFGSAIGAIE